MRIAMWSGPRNLSTAMMYSFGNRSDFAVWDEPFYAAYLATTGLDHPMRDDILAAHEADPNKVATRCIDAIPAQKPYFYMKHMPHHMINEVPLDWAHDCVNVHLIRHPARVIASYGEKRSEMNFDDIGFAQQAAIYDKFGGYVIDSADIRANPEMMLRKLCDAIGLDFDPAMLSWPAGPHEGDGIWASHWYNAVHKSTGFAGAEGPLPELEGAAAELCAQALPYYERLAALKL
ncbi:sulfotransferase [Yoonia sp. I 8.24]|uniref:sulfotransferase n=1 Tax=Yoonia sp. I 8.24 TaxID=1537229 RepID=UPI001EDFC773|nr:sulfotransferase [Yoonia sp. I 8.24]MCG3268447.1 HAD family hydrolase [Yoonia sp. I 8.24]